VGYSRLIGVDEVGTLTALKALRRELVEPTLKRHHGRTVKLLGDGLLAEFGSVVEAVSAAAEIQQAMPDRFAEGPEEQSIQVRIGINLGDVVVEGSDLYGDGVNVAARLQETAAPGGIAVSDAAYMHLGGKLDLAFVDAGEHELKNIAKPVRVWQWSPAGTIKPVAANLSLSDKPTIAVLPFDNVSGDPEQEYFADGIAEDIITELSRFRSLCVIARNSTFVYKGRPTNIGDVGRELGANYVLEGSVRRGGDRVRVTAQLIEAHTGKHLWADRYDRSLEDIFSLQDEVTENIVSTLMVRLEEAERVRSMRSNPENLSAYECWLRGKCLFHKGSKDELLEARALFERAIDLDATFAPAYIDLGETYYVEAGSSWAKSPEAAIERVFELARTAMELDPHDSRAHLSMSWAYLNIKSDHDLAKMQIDEAIRLNPNDYYNYCFKGWLSTCLGELEEAVACSNEALRRSPLVPDGCLFSRVAAEYLAGNYGEAIMAFGRMLRPSPTVCAWVAAAYAQEGRMDEARAKLEEFYQGVSALPAAPAREDEEGWLEYWSKEFPSKDSSAREQLFDGLRKAGLAV
jgi:TolB-like protein